MNIQIFGFKKCSDTRKAERFFKERKIKFQLVNLSEKGMSKGELTKVAAVIGIKNLINIESKQYEKRNLKYIRHDIQTVLLEDSLLFKTPIVRNGSRSTVGYQPEIWKSWISEEK